MGKTIKTILITIICNSVIIMNIFGKENEGMVSNFDVCEMHHIYSENYQYSLPQKFMESYLSGKAFDNPEYYTTEESVRLREDINEIYQTIISADPIKERVAVMTAGAPGAGKTIKMKQELETDRLKGHFYAYICPDDVCLKSQTRTYIAEVEKGDGSPSERQMAYNKWRPGSNAATHLILANLIREKYAFYFGTTSTGPATGKFLEFLKSQGYYIKLIHVSAPDDVRWKSIKERDKTFIQTTEQDVREKGLLLPQRINDTYLKYADEIGFYYRDGVKKDAVLAATWIRNKDEGLSLGALEVLLPEEYEKIKSIHNEAAKILSRPDLYWETLRF